MKILRWLTASLLILPLFLTGMLCILLELVIATVATFLTFTAQLFGLANSKLLDVAKRIKLSIT